MTPYKTLRDLPGAPAGTLSDYKGQSVFMIGAVDIELRDIERFPDWFAEVKEETLEDAVDAMIRHWRDSAHCMGECKYSDNLRAVYNRVKAEREKIA